MDYCFWCSSYFDRHDVRCLCVRGVHHTEPRRNVQELCSMRNTDKLLLEVLDEALKLLPPKMPTLKQMKSFSPVTSIAKVPRRIPEFNKVKK